MRTICLCAATLSIVACSEPHDAQFRYENCFLGCEIATPMMLDDEEDVIVTGSIPATVSVETTAPSVVLVKSTSRTCCPTESDASSALCHTVTLNDACEPKETASLAITVHALAEGTSDLLIKKSDGSVWGSVALSVEKATSLALACNTQGNVTLAPGGSCPVTWRATANGTGLMSTAGIFISSSAPSVVVFNGFLNVKYSDDIHAGPYFAGDVSMFALGAGDATVTALGGGATETLAVHVTP